MSSDHKRSQYIASFLANLRLEKGLSTNTINAYANDCRSFLKWSDSQGDINILNLQEDQVEKYVKSFQDQNLTSSSINRKISSLKHLYFFLHKKKLVQSNPHSKFFWSKEYQTIAKINVST